MARMRTVKPEFFRSATNGRVSRDARLLFIGMWTEADDHGRGLAEPKHLAGTLFPYDRDVTERKICKLLRELADVTTADGTPGLIVLYEANGSTLYAIRGWHHQKVNRPGPPRYPAPPAETLFDPPPPSTTPSHGTTTASATPDSLNDRGPIHGARTEDALNGGRQVSEVRVQGSGSKPNNSSESVGNDRARAEQPAAVVDHQPLEPRPLAGLLAIGIDRTRAIEAIQTHGEATVSDVLAKAKGQPNIRSLAGYVLTALDNGYQIDQPPAPWTPPTSTDPDEAEQRARALFPDKFTDHPQEAS